MFPEINNYINNNDDYSYKLLKALKATDDATVFLGCDIFEKLWAIKVYFSKFEDSLDYLKKKCKKIKEKDHSHSNIIYLHDIFYSYQYSCFFFVYEYLPFSLIDILQKVSNQKIITIARDILFGLSYLHYLFIDHNPPSLGSVLHDGHNQSFKLANYPLFEDLEPYRINDVNKDSHIYPHKSFLSNITLWQRDLYYVGLIMLSLKKGVCIPVCERIDKSSIDDIIADDPKMKNIVCKLLGIYPDDLYRNGMSTWEDLHGLMSKKKFF